MIDWNPSDPEEVKVHYDVAGWTLDQRAELLEALATDDIDHVWSDDELVVPEQLEAVVDALFDRLEVAIGPFPVALDGEVASVEYDLDEWPAAERATLATAVVRAAIAHRWDGATLHVGPESEQIVDEMLDALESGTLLLDDAEEGEEASADLLPQLFAAADRLAKDSEDGAGRDAVRTLGGAADPTRAPYGVGGGTWSKIVEELTALSDLVADSGASSSDVIGAAQRLRGLVRQYV